MLAEHHADEVVLAPHPAVKAVSRAVQCRMVLAARFLHADTNLSDPDLLDPWHQCSGVCRVLIGAHLMQAKPLKRGLYALKNLHLFVGSLKLKVSRAPLLNPCAPLLEVSQQALIAPPGGASASQQLRLGQHDSSGAQWTYLCTARCRWGPGLSQAITRDAAGLLQQHVGHHCSGRQRITGAGPLRASAHAGLQPCEERIPYTATSQVQASASRDACPAAMQAGCTRRQCCCTCTRCSRAWRWGL